MRFRNAYSYRGDWDKTFPYVDNDIVRLGILIYRCINSQGVRGVQPSTDSTRWQIITPEPFVNGGHYWLGALVSYLSCVYQSLTEDFTANDTPDNDKTNWQIVLGASPDALEKTGDTMAGPLVLADTLTAEGAATFKGSATFQGPASFNEGLHEPVILLRGGLPSIVNLDASAAGHISYSTDAATGNFTVNFRGDTTHTLDNVLSVGDSVTFCLLVTNGATAYVANTFTIDGNPITPKWQNGSAQTTGDVNAVDVYGFTIIKTAPATFVLLADKVMYA